MFENDPTREVVNFTSQVIIMNHPGQIGQLGVRRQILRMGRDPDTRPGRCEDVHGAAQVPVGLKFQDEESRIDGHGH